MSVRPSLVLWQSLLCTLGKLCSLHPSAAISPFSHPVQESLCMKPEGKGSKMPRKVQIYKAGMLPTGSCNTTAASWACTRQGAHSQALQGLEADKCLSAHWRSSASILLE